MEIMTNGVSDDMIDLLKGKQFCFRTAGFENEEEK